MRLFRLYMGVVLMLGSLNARSQSTFSFEGQASAVTNYSPRNDLDILLGLRYIPGLNYNLSFGKGKSLDFLVSVNTDGHVMFQPFSEYKTEGSFDPYRIWVRYAGNQFEVRLGLQKIDFGSATILRPLQWFNQTDPRDPLELTNGVYGTLGRYYFLNNANIWVWLLYGNEKRRGFDVLETHDRHPEFGGRVQHPVPKGEIAVSYHHRTAQYRHSENNLLSFEQIPEDRVGFDGKWDVEVGLWLEVSHIRKSKKVGRLTNQTLLNAGVDYTFALGNGLNVVAEHLFMGMDEKALQFKDNINMSASTMSYPVGLWGNLSTVFYYDWGTNGFTFFTNYERRFKKLTGYAMAYYNSGHQQGIVQAYETINTFQGPGIRLMIVYNH